MTLVAGASRFVNQVAAAQFGGSSVSAPSILSESAAFGAGASSMLESARSINSGFGLGISSSARALNSQFFAQSKALGNQILSLSAGTDATSYGAQQEILAMRSRLSDSQLAPSLRSTAVDDGGVSSSDTGTSVDIEA